MGLTPSLLCLCVEFAWWLVKDGLLDGFHHTLRMHGFVFVAVWAAFSRVFSCTFVPSAAAFTNPLDSDPFHWGLWSFCSTSARLFHGNVLRQTEKGRRRCGTSPGMIPEAWEEILQGSLETELETSKKKTKQKKNLFLPLERLDGSNYHQLLLSLYRRPEPRWRACLLLGSRLHPQYITQRHYSFNVTAAGKYWDFLNFALRFYGTSPCN